MKCFWFLVALHVVVIVEIGFSREKPIQINIDDPSFRQLVVAIKRIEISKCPNSECAAKVAGARVDFAKSLELTGFFSVLNIQAFEDVGKGHDKSKKVLLPGFEGVDFDLWRSLGVEALIVPKIIPIANGKFRVEIRTAHLSNRLNKVVAKGYTIDSLDKLGDIFRVYIDRLSEEYTKKPGIYSSRIVFVGRKEKNSPKRVYICDIDGRNVTQISTGKDDAIHLSPNWSRTTRGNQQIVYTSLEKKNGSLYLLDLNKLETRVIADYDGVNSGGVFSRNSSLIAFSGSSDGKTKIFLTDLKGMSRRIFLGERGLNVDGTFSPNDNYFAFVSDRLGKPDIYIATLKWNAAKTEVQVTSMNRITRAGWYNANPAFSSESDLVWAGYNKPPELDKPGQFDIFKSEINGTNMGRLTINRGDNVSPSVLPNGWKIVFESNRVKDKNIKGPSQLFIMNRDGSDQRLIPTGMYEAQSPQVEPYYSEVVVHN